MLPYFQSFSSSDLLLVLLRGLPGSGKSTLSKVVCAINVKAQSHSADDFFIDEKSGRYVYDPNGIHSAHAQCMERTRQAMQEKCPLVVIDNTNTQAWEMLPYAKLAGELEYTICVIEPNTAWKFKSKELASHTLHGVPQPKIKLMLDRYERDLSSTFVAMSLLSKQPKALDISIPGPNGISKMPYRPVIQNSSPSQPTRSPWSNRRPEPPANQTRSTFSTTNSNSTDPPDRGRPKDSGVSDNKENEQSGIFPPPRNKERFRRVQGRNDGPPLRPPARKRSPEPNPFPVLSGPDEESSRPHLASLPVHNAMDRSQNQKSNNKDNDDFMCLLQFFPDASLDQLYVTYVECNRDLDRTVNVILDAGHKSEATGEAEIRIGSETSQDLTGLFGSPPSGPSDPVIVSIPRPVLSLIYLKCKKVKEERLTEKAIQKLVLHDEEQNRSPTPPSYHDPFAGLPPQSSLPAQPIEDDGDGYFNEEEFEPVTKADIELLTKKRNEAYQKAATAYKSRQGGVAAYYSEEGRRMTQVIQEKKELLNIQTYQELVAQRPSLKMIDLHGLKVDEAVEILGYFIHDKKLELKRTPGIRSIKFEVVTGKGTHTKARIKPAVTRALDAMGLNWIETNPGSVEVVIAKTDVVNEATDTLPAASRIVSA